ncbi:MAG TPA: phospho-N-acetylmuramoyl-pentapeptide-transferase [Phycisphaerales bacterium]|nr:phospho-N-acetylmuramoyl-pentapeptide-transferase [Phycisphaerales bacterium]
MLYLLWVNLEKWLDDLGVRWMFKILDQLTFRALAAAAIAFFVVVLLGRPVIGWLRRKKIGDAGLADTALLASAAQSKANVPTMGGLLICAAIVGATGLLGDVSNAYLVAGLLVLTFLAGLGSVDDWLKLTAASRPGGSRQGLHSWEKLIFQLGLGFLVAWFVYNKGDTAGTAKDVAHVLSLPFQATYEGGGLKLNPGVIELPKMLFVFIGVLMIAGMSNALNITDGMDGLAAGTTAIVSLGMAVLVYVAGWQTAAQYLLVPYIADSSELLVLIAATAGACLGFLWWNCSPAQVFMGDTGSLALGGVLGYLAIVIRQEALLLIMSGVFLMEISSVVMQVGYFKYTRRRTGAGQRLFRVAPIHHHFHIVGWTEQTVVTRFWIITAILVIAALALVKVR